MSLVWSFTKCQKNCSKSSISRSLLLNLGHSLFSPFMVPISGYLATHCPKCSSTAGSPNTTQGNFRMSYPASPLLIKLLSATPSAHGPPSVFSSVSEPLCPCYSRPTCHRPHFPPLLHQLLVSGRVPPSPPYKASSIPNGVEGRENTHALKHVHYLFVF